MENIKNKRVAYWLIIGVVMILIQTLLGGVTRLTGSGLSITKWNPLFGVLPPLNTNQWNQAFEGYKKIGQFQYVNSYFTLEDFKYIFFWEWLHRLWARLLGVVFIIGFVYFLWNKYFIKSMVQPLIILLLLGGLQGLIGWLMVKTGLNSEDIHVHYFALTTHFISAMILACYTLWFALKLIIPDEQRITNKRLYSFTVFTIVILFLQLIYGGFMAGLKAAIVASTWPLMNGVYFPETLFNHSIFKDENLGALQLNVQFVHRNLAYLLIIVVSAWYVLANKSAKMESQSIITKTKIYPILFILLQVILGICTIICSTYIQQGKFGIFETLAELHQLTAMFLLMSFVLNLYVLKIK